MNLFNSILEELSKKIKGAEIYKEEVSLVISRLLNININPDQIAIKNGTLFLNVSPTIKSALLLKKEMLIKELSKFNIKTIV
jgi:hypothetical protein